MKRLHIFAGTAAVALLLTGCASSANFPRHTVDFDGFYPAAQLYADLEIVSSGDVFCPYLTFEDGDRLILVLESDATVTADSIEWQGNYFVPGPVTGGGGASTIDYDDAGCERTEEIWILSPAN